MTTPLHPALFAAFPVLFLVAHNADVTTPGQAIAPAVIAVGVVVALQLVATAAFGSARKIGAAMSALVVLFFSYGHAASVTRAADTVLVPVWVALAALAITAVIRTRRTLADLTRVLNVVAVVLVVTALVPAVRDLGGSPVVRAEHARATYRAPGAPRDIYYLVFDRYADAEVLSEHFGFDNSPFIETLEARGFVVTDSRANYQNTHMSLASSLNMDHLEGLTSDVPQPSTDREPFFDLVRDNAVARTLKSAGYRYIHVGSWASYTASSPLADVNLDPLDSSELTRTLYASTALAPLLRARDDASGDERITQRDATRGALRALDAAIAMDGPKYVFAHFIIPHPPYVFDRDGTYVRRGSHEGDIDGYVDQIRYTNAQIDRITKTLLDRPPEQRPIIVIQADEGPYPRLSTRFPRSWADEPGGDVRVKYGILSAYHVPRAEGAIYDAISPVNTFRVIFNRYFGGHHPMLGDESYALRDKSDAYTWVSLEAAVRARPPPYSAR